MAGKLNGVMPATTPSGWRSDHEFDLGADIAAVLAFQEMRDAAGEIDDVDAAGELAARIGVGLAMLLGDGAGNLVGVTVEKLLEAEHVGGALERRRRAPTRGRLLGSGDGFIHFFDGRKREAGGLLSGRWVVDGRHAPR